MASTSLPSSTGSISELSVWITKTLLGSRLLGFLIP